MNLAVNDKTFFQVKSEANTAINNISKQIYDKKSGVKYANQYAFMISEFKKHPDKFKLKNTLDTRSNCSPE